MATQQEKAEVFRNLHQGEGAFIIPNPYDAGTAIILEKLGFEALATTSAGYAFSCGKQDNQVTRDDMINHAEHIVQVTSLPVSADLENGFGPKLEDVALTIKKAGQVGLVGGSIEDSVNGVGGEPSGEPLFNIGFAKERIIAAVEAKKSLPNDFVLTARAENYLVGRGDLSDVIKRLQAYQEAGADVLFAPGLTSKEDIETVVANVDLPVNVVMGLQGVQLGQTDLSGLGVKRISTGSSLSRAALGAFLRASEEMLQTGTFSFAEDAVPYGKIDSLFKV